MSLVNKLKPTLLALLLCVGGSVSLAATAEEALKGCKGYPDVEMPNTCRAYFMAILEAIDSEDPMINPRGPLCIDDDIPVAEIIATTTAWIESNPAQSEIALFHAVHSALSAEFQCD